MLTCACTSYMLGTVAPTARLPIAPACVMRAALLGVSAGRPAINHAPALLDDGKCMADAVVGMNMLPFVPPAIMAWCAITNRCCCCCWYASTEAAVMYGRGAAAMMLLIGMLAPALLRCA
ncbi:hypothetical protein EON67_06595 [archaeon]|nr:MAG: hypothetical protein EON67_06595 [archaeon]